MIIDFFTNPELNALEYLTGRKGMPLAKGDVIDVHLSLRSPLQQVFHRITNDEKLQPSLTRLTGPLPFYKFVSTIKLVEEVPGDYPYTNVILDCGIPLSFAPTIHNVHDLESWKRYCADGYSFAGYGFLHGSLEVVGGLTAYLVRGEVLDTQTLASDKHVRELYVIKIRTTTPEKKPINSFYIKTNQRVVYLQPTD